MQFNQVEYFVTMVHTPSPLYLHKVVARLARRRAAIGGRRPSRHHRQIGLVQHRHRVVVVVHALRLALAQAAAAEQREQIAPILSGQDRVQIRIGARVQRIKEHEQNLRFGHIDERHAGQSGQAEEGNWRPARKVREHLRENRRYIVCRQTRYCLIDHNIYFCLLDSFPKPGYQSI